MRLFHRHDDEAPPDGPARSFTVILPTERGEETMQLPANARVVPTDRVDERAIVAKVEKLLKDAELSDKADELVTQLGITKSEALIYLRQKERPKKEPHGKLFAKKMNDIGQYMSKDPMGYMKKER